MGPGTKRKELVHMRISSVTLPLVASATLALALFAAAASAETVAEDFEDGMTPGVRSYGVPHVIEMSGGNPGRYLHASGLDTFAPQPQSSFGPTFHGDFRARGVTSMGIDLITHDVDFSADGRQLTLILVNNNGTPS